MDRYTKPLLLAAAMIAVALLAIFDVVPEGFARWAPLALLAIFPSAWLGNRRCGREARA